MGKKKTKFHETSVIGQTIDHFLDYSLIPDEWTSITNKYPKDILIHKIMKQLSMPCQSINSIRSLKNTIKSHLKIEGKYIDQGSYGDVFRYGSNVVKYIQIVEDDEMYCIRELIYASKVNDLNIFAKMHSVIFQFNYFTNKVKGIAQVMENGGQSIHKWLKTPRSSTEKIDIFKNICGVVQKLHDNNMCHGDLKLRNILIDNDKVLLCDFGTGGRKDIVFTEVITTYCYAPPDILYILLDPNHVSIITGEAIDTFSILCVGYNMMVGTTVFMDKDGDPKVIYKIQNDMLKNKKLQDNIFARMLYDYTKINTIKDINAYFL